MAPNQPVVRLATVEDAHAIAVAHVEGWRAAYPSIIPASYLDALNIDARAEQWTSILRGEAPVEGVGLPTDFVVEVDGAVIGFADVGEFRDAPRNEVGELWAMYVHPDHWRTGAGGALMERTLEHLASGGCHVGYLWVLTENAPARRFYEKWGWELDPTIEPKSFEIDGVAVGEVAYRIDVPEAVGTI